MKPNRILHLTQQQLDARLREILEPHIEAYSVGAETYNEISKKLISEEMSQAASINRAKSNLCKDTALTLKAIAAAGFNFPE